MNSAPSSRTRILFVCTENACRSQIAEAFARALGRGTVEVWSAGSRPRGTMDDAARVVMAEEGLMLLHHRSKGLETLPAIEWDVLVTMGCGEECPALPAKRRLDWAIPDPKGKPLDEYRAVRDKIRVSVAELLDKRRAPSASTVVGR